MSRSVSAPFQTGLDEHITVPIYLVEVLLSTPLYWTTGAAVTWDSKNWVPDALVVGQVTEVSARINIRNDDNSGSSLILNNKLLDIEFRIYLFYNGDAIEIFRGYGGATAINAMQVTINLHSTRADKTKAPRTRIAGPVFTRLPKPGTLLGWGDDQLKVTN